MTAEDEAFVRAMIMTFTDILITKRIVTKGELVEFIDKNGGDMSGYLQQLVAKKGMNGQNQL